MNHSEMQFQNIQGEFSFQAMLQVRISRRLACKKKKKKNPSIFMLQYILFCAPWEKKMCHTGLKLAYMKLSK